MLLVRVCELSSKTEIKNCIIW